MDKKRKYAKFLIKGCLRLNKDSKLFIIGNTYIIDFINIVREEANNLGIKDIKTLINNPLELKELYLNKTYEEIIKSPLVDKSIYNEMAKDGYAFLMLSSPLPNFYQDVDSNLITKVSQYQAKSISIYRELQAKNLIKWNICSVANDYWAYNLNLTLDELWEHIFNICLINEEDPIKAWNNKLLKLQDRCNYLNNLGIIKLKYENKIGTNIEIGLPKDYLFQSANYDVIVNMPTEEVFTSPDRLKVNGKVYASKILYNNNRIIKDFWLEFKDGRIINYDAKEGLDVLKGIIETDQGSHYLGEVALVDYNSPISLTNITFKETLYDENASCHLAIGTGFLECIKDGLNLNKEESLAKGINYSEEHVDFFIGTNDLKITAYLQNGEKLVIMNKGNFLRR